MKTPKVTILGIGNVLWADEGFGVRAVETLHQHYTFPEEVTLLDGGTQGLYLVQHVQAAELLLVFDAVDYGLPPGTLKRVEDDAVPRFLGAKKMSLHQTGFQEVLFTAQLLGDYPRHLLLVGVQPEELEDYGGSLRPRVKAQIDPAIDVALAWLDRHGIPYRPRSEPLSAAERLGPEPLNLHSYEIERPSEQAACRRGDARVLVNKAVAFDPKPCAGAGRRLAVNVDRRGDD